MSASPSVTVALTVNKDLVENVDGLDENFINPLTEDHTDELFCVMSSALSSLLHTTAKAAGYAPSPAFNPANGFNVWDEKSASNLRKAMGSKKIGSTLSVRPSKQGKQSGFTISIPILHNSNIFAGSGSGSFGMVRPDDASRGQHFYANAAQRKFAVQLFGKESAQKAVDPNVGFTFALSSGAELLKSNGLFNLTKVSNGSKDLEKALNTYFQGFRFQSPPLASSVVYPGPRKEGVKVASGKMPTKDEVTDAYDYYSYILQSRTWSVYFDLFLPEEYARYVTQTPSGPINLAQLNMFWSLWLLGDIGENSEFQAVSAVSSLTNVRTANKTASRTFRSQLVNKKDLSISSDAYAYFLPEIDQIDAYEADFLQFGMHESDGSYSLNSFDRLPPGQHSHAQSSDDAKTNRRKMPRNRLIYTDFNNFRIAYSDDEGLSSTKNIEDWMSLSPTDATHLLNRRLYTDRTWNRVVLNDLSYVMANRLESLGLNAIAVMKSSDEWAKFGWDEYIVNHLATELNSGLHNYLKELSTVLVTEFFRKMTENDDSGAPRRLDDIAFKDLFNGLIPGLQWLGKLMVEASARIRKLSKEALAQYLAERSIMNALRECGTLMALAENGIMQEEVFREDKEIRRAYLNTVNPKKGTHKPRPLPFVQQDRSLLPHQVRTDGILENNNPQFVILAADAGGGKTLMVLRDALSRIQSGKSKRPVLCMPDNLIRNYVADAVYMFGAGINCIPITTDTLNAHSAEGLKKIVDSAPSNTILLTSYRFISGSSEQIYYGTDVIDYNPNMELLRSFECDAIYCDESHFLRNDSAMTKATRRFAYSIPYRVLATGTLVNKELSDIANQVSLFMPSLFGNKSDFQEEYAEVMRGNTVVAWKPGAETMLRKKLAENCLVIQCKRKEWAALLPNRVETLHVIGDAAFRQSMWYQTYQAILTETLELIKKDDKLVKKLAGSESLSDDEEINIEALLRPYIARLEMFLTAPERDDLGSKILKGKDRIGPKISEVVRLCNEHINKKIPGKILIFTSYHNSADSIYDNLPPALKKMAIRYHAENSAEDLGEFERNKDKMILIGTENTLNTGHNFQMASRIIRIESTWTPGNLEQSMARVYRPDPKNMSGIDRKNIYLDWVIVNWTIDITKISRLISRVLNKALFDEHDNPAFGELPNLPVVSMSLDSIAGANDFDSSMLEYADGYSQYLSIVKKDLEDYRNDPANALTMTKLLADTKGMDGAALMAMCPYSPDQVLPPQVMEEMHLVRISDYAREHGKEVKGIAAFDAKGLYVHTERGEGIVLRSSGTTVRVKLRDGGTEIFDKMSVLVITDNKMPAKPVRKRVSEVAGLPVAGKIYEVDGTKKSGKGKTLIPVLEAPKPAGTKVMPPNVRRSSPNEQLQPAATGKPLSLEIYAIYDMLAIDLEDVETLTKKDLTALEAVGFRTGGKYSMCDVPNLAKFDLLLEKMQENYVVSAANMKVLRDLRKAFTGGKAKLFTAHRAMSLEMKNFWRIQSKPAEKNEIRPYPIVWEGDLHIAVRHFKQPAAMTVKQKLRVPGVTWQVVEDDYMLFCKDKNDVLQKVKKIQAAGFMLRKPKAFEKSLSLIRMQKKKDE